MSIKSDAIVIRDETATGANTAVRVGGNLVAIADDLVAKQVEVNANNAKVSYTDASAVAANTAKVSYPSADSTKLSGIETNADVNTINSTVTGEPTGSDLVLNVVSLTQAEYDAGTKVATTLYVIS